MQNDIKYITCPKCGELISEDFLTSQIKERFAREFEEREKDFKKSLERDNESVLAKKEEEIVRQTKEKIEKESHDEKNYLEEQLKEKGEKLRLANQIELELRKEKQKLKEEKDTFELDKTRQLDVERKKIEEDASRRATDAKQSEIDQLNKNLLNTQKALDEAQRKAAQGSQQTQGEVQEIALEELLKAEFIYDDIFPVPKGVGGADVIQTIRSKTGVECGTIIWESKKTKSWTEGWIQKLKDDQRSMNADVAVIVTSALPAGVEGIVFRDGVWVCGIKLAISIATALHHQLEAVSREKRLSIGKDDNKEILYNYVTGTEFTQKVLTIVETFNNMSLSLINERTAYEKIWSEREKQMQKIRKNIGGIIGDLSSTVPLQKIELLELPEPAKNEEN